jgi:uncharacterized protein (TIGR02594 family)
MTGMVSPISGYALKAENAKPAVDAWKTLWAWADANAPWLRVAYAEALAGVKEVRGSKVAQSNPKIVEYLQSCAVNETQQKDDIWNSDETAWCSAFVNWSLKRCGIKGTNHLNSQSWADWPGGIRLKQPQFGCITVFERPKGKNGHVAFCWSAEKRLFLGGNQGDRTAEVKRSDRVNITYVGKPILCHIWPIRPVNPPKAAAGTFV